MKKEQAVIGFIAVAVIGFAVGRMTAPGGGATEAAGGEESAKATTSTKVSLPIAHSYVKGPKEAKVTIIEFSDFQCPFCTRVNPTIKQIQDTYKDDVRIAFKHNALPFHKDAKLAAEASMAAGAQGKFWEMHDKLFENQKALKRPELDKYAAELGLDMAKFKKDLDTHAYAKVVDEDQALAKKWGARGTPGFFINGVQLKGAQPFDKFKAVIDKELAAANDLVKKGTKVEDVYAARLAKNLKAPAAAGGTGGAAEPDKRFKFAVGKAHTKGPADAPVTIIEVSDFQCPFCSRVNPTMKKIMDTYKDKVRIAFKHNPLSFHKDALGAAEAAEAAGAQGKFWEMHDKLFANQKALKRPELDKYAQEIGLNMAKFKADMDGNTFKAQILNDQKTSNRLGARGTPAFFVNGWKLSGAKPFSAFKEKIDEELKEADKLIKKGIAKDKIYAELTKNGLTKAPARAAKKERPQRPQKDPKAVYKMELRGDEAAKGPKDALVTVVEYSDFECPFCSRVNPTMKGIEKKYGKDLRIVWKHNPLPFHKKATGAAMAAEAAKEQGKFWEMHDLLFANQKKLDRPELDGYAKQLGLNMAKYTAFMDGNKASKQIADDQKAARALGASGTPAFFINGRNLSGAQPQASFERVIDEELARAKALVAKGTPKSKLYAELIKNGETKPKYLPDSGGKAAAGGGGGGGADVRKAVAVSPADPWKGGKNAKVTIVEWSDFQCPFCSRVNPTMDKIKETYGDKVKVVFKQNPLSFHKDAKPAAKAALAAHEQGKFWEMHDLLFANQKKLQAADLEGYAQQLGLNMAKFKAAMGSDKFDKQISADQAQAASLGARGTPAFFVNGRQLRGAQPFERFKEIIDEELAGKGPKALAKKG